MTSPSQHRSSLGNAARQAASPLTPERETGTSSSLTAGSGQAAGAGVNLTDSFARYFGFGGAPVLCLAYLTSPNVIWPGPRIVATPLPFFAAPASAFLGDTTSLFFLSLHSILHIHTARHDTMERFRNLLGGGGLSMGGAAHGTVRLARLTTWAGLAVAARLELDASRTYANSRSPRRITPASSTTRKPSTSRRSPCSRCCDTAAPACPWRSWA